jgi:hypothetical protein
LALNTLDYHLELLNLRVDICKSVGIKINFSPKLTSPLLILGSLLEIFVRTLNPLLKDLLRLAELSDLKPRPVDAQL